MLSAPERSHLSPLDVISWVMDRPRRPLDFTLIIHSAQIPEIEALRAGAMSARNLYAVTGSRIDGGQWVRLPESVDGVQCADAASESEVRAALQEFVDRPFDLCRQAPVRQLLIADARAAGSILATRFHHAAADGTSAAMWLAHQLRVALGAEAPVAEAGPVRPPALRARTDGGAGPHGPRHRSRRPWHRPGRPRRARGWCTVEVSCGDLRRWTRERGEFTYSDLLATSALETFIRWNQAHGAGHRQVGVWLPVNIRRTRRSGFGNGTSRVRVHATYPAAAAFVAKCGHVHHQVRRSMRCGEWAIRRHPLLRVAPRSVTAALLRAYLGRPWADMGSATFSHADRWGVEPREFFDRVDRIECIGPLHARHCAAVYGVTHGDRTWLTFTYDPALLGRSDVDELAAMYLDQIELARREMTCEG